MADRQPAVCVVRHAYYPDLHVRRDAETLAQSGYDVSVVALRRPGQPARERLGGVEVYRMPVGHKRGSALRYLYEYAAFFLCAFVVVTYLHLRKRLAIVEADSMPDVLVWSALVPKLTGVRVLLYIFDNMPELFRVSREVGPAHPAVRVLAFLERLSAAVADHVIVTQETARRIVIGRGTRAEKVSVVLNCPDEALFDPRQPARGSRQDGAFTIVTHGAVVERYGVHVLIDALAAIAAEAPEARLEVYGEGEQLPELRERARRNGVADRVRFRGRVPLEDLLAGLRRADVGYAGMLCDNMLSNKLVEYAALRVPAVVARWSTFEYYFPEDAVRYFAPGDPAGLAEAILAHYRDPAGALARAEQAHELYGAYAWPAQRAAYLRVYTDCLADGHRTRASVFKMKPS